MSDLLQVGAASSGHFADGPIEVIDAEEYLGIGAGSDILIVDDDETNLTAYEAALAPLGRKLVLLRSGIDALARLLERDFALMLLDVSMPDMGGLETARRVRARARNRGMPILMITGVAHDTEAIIQAYGAGASDYLIKPVLPYVLRAKASVYLELQERTKDLLQYSQRLRDTQSLLTKTDQLLREREAAATTAKRIEKLQEATAALAQARTPADVATAAVGLGAEAMYATAGAMWTLAPDGALQLAGSHGIDDEHMAPWLRIASDSAIPAMRVLVRREPIWVECEADYEREAPETYDAARNWRGGWAFTALPLVVAGKGIGVLSYM
ncbi:MAG TPA: response regulator, partial [Pirellulales bacterium]|nr:response regulator [Pirellulales bacterium]